MSNAKFKKIKNVTLPQLKIKANVEYFIKFISAMYTGKEIPEPPKINPKTGEVEAQPPRKPAQIAQVKNLETDEDCMIVVSKVMEAELHDAYPGDSYVGKCFGFVITKVEGKDYNLVSIYEVAEPEPEDKVEMQKSLDAVEAETDKATKSVQKKK